MPVFLLGTLSMKAILIDPAQRSLEWIDIPEGTGRVALMRLHEIVGDSLDFAYILPGESIAVGDHSALKEPPLPRFRIDGCKYALYGRGVVLGFRKDGSERPTKLTLEELSKLIEFE